MKNLLRSTPAIRRILTLLAISAMSTGPYFTDAYAQEPPEIILDSSSRFIDILPTITTAEDPEAPLPAQTTHAPIRLTPDKSEIIKLETEAGSIIIGNPAHLSVLADTSKTLVLVPKAVGATHLSVMDKQGNILMQRHVIIAGPTTDYIRIKKTCASDAKGCEQTSVYYCPDTCHEIESYKEEK
jgi:Flp pilus assembly secretin CpaC